MQIVVKICKFFLFSWCSTTLSFKVVGDFYSYDPLLRFVLGIPWGLLILQYFSLFDFLFLFLSLKKVKVLEPITEKQICRKIPFFDVFVVFYLVDDSTNRIRRSLRFNSSSQPIRYLYFYKSTFQDKYINLNAPLILYRLGSVLGLNLLIVFILEVSQFYWLFL